MARQRRERGSGYAEAVIVAFVLTVLLLAGRRLVVKIRLEQRCGNLSRVMANDAMRQCSELPATQIVPCLIDVHNRSLAAFSNPTNNPEGRQFTGVVSVYRYRAPGPVVGYSSGGPPASAFTAGSFGVGMPISPGDDDTSPPVQGQILADLGSVSVAEVECQSNGHLFENVSSRAVSMY